MIKTFRLIVTLIILTACVGLAASQANAQTHVGSGKTYTTLKAAFDAINTGTLPSSVVLQIGSTTETASTVLNASGSGCASYTSESIYTTGSGHTITGSLNGSLIDLNGANNVTINGWMCKCDMLPCYTSRTSHFSLLTNLS